MNKIEQIDRPKRQYLKMNLCEYVLNIIWHVSSVIAFCFKISKHLEADKAAYYVLTCEQVDTPSLYDPASVLTSVQVGEIKY